MAAEASTCSRSRPVHENDKQPGRWVELDLAVLVISVFSPYRVSYSLLNPTSSGSTSASLNRTRRISFCQILALLSTAVQPSSYGLRSCRQGARWWYPLPADEGTPTLCCSPAF